MTAPKPTENEVKCRAKIAELHEEYVKINRRLTYWTNKLKKETEKKYDFVSKMTIKNADWEEILILDQPETKVKCEIYIKLMRELGFWPDGYHPETMQRIIKIMIRTSKLQDCIKQTLKSLKLIIPYIKPLKPIKSKDKETYKIIHIFCDYEDGIPNLLINKEDKACVSFTHYGKFELITKWDTLKNTVLFIGNEFPYEDD